MLLQLAKMIMCPKVYLVCGLFFRHGTHGQNGFTQAGIPLVDLSELLSGIGGDPWLISVTAREH
jgi:hypothetical protein